MHEVDYLTRTPHALSTALLAFVCAPHGNLLHFRVGGFGAAMRAFKCGVVSILYLNFCAFAYAQDSDPIVDKFRSKICNFNLEPGTPGSTPERAITFKFFDELHHVAVSAQYSEEGKPKRRSQYECNWIELSGFFTPLSYYDYLGYFVESAGHWYGSPQVRYVIEKFESKSLRRLDLAHRRVTLVGQFYDLCAAEEREEQELQKENPNSARVRFGGLCHYGEDNGMILINVRVKQIHDREPRYLSGERNRDLINELPSVPSSDRLPMEALVRDWVSWVQKGPDQFAKEKDARNPDRAERKEEERKKNIERIAHVDGYASYLHSLETFRKLDPKKAEVAVFWDWSYGQGRTTEAVGCMCWKANCADIWPIFAKDVREYIGGAACMHISREDALSAWVWD